MGRVRARRPADKNACFGANDTGWRIRSRTAGSAPPIHLAGANKDVRATIKADDGAPIDITYDGIASRSKKVAERLAAGKVITAADECFVTAPTMQTRSTKYAWLNHVRYVGKIVEVKIGGGSYVKHDIFIVR